MALLSRFGLLFGLVAATVLRSAEVLPGANDRWKRFESAHFEMYSGVNDADSRALLRDLEVIRHMFYESTALRERRPTPVTIYYFRDPRDFRAYLPDAYKRRDRISGLYHGGPDRSVILLAPGSEADDSRRVIFHEFIHHLMEVTEENPPLWYNEGLAELFSTIEIRSDTLLLGQAPVGRVLQLQHADFIPLERLFSVGGDSSLYTGGTEHTGTLYAQSWAIVHYCYLGLSKIPREKLSQFLRAARDPSLSANAERMRQASRQFLGVELDEFNELIGGYIRGGRYQALKVDLPKDLPSPKSYRTDPVAPETIALRLAELQVRTNQQPYAKLMLLNAVNRDGTADPRPSETLGSLSLRERNTNLAQQYWDQAVTLGSTNDAVFHQLAQIEAQKWFRAYDPDFRLSDEAATRLRFLLSHSLQAAPDQSSAYEILAWVEATSKAPDIENLNEVQRKFADLKNKPRTLLAISVLRARMNDTETPRKVLPSLRAAGIEPWVAYGAETLLAKLENRRPDYDAVPALKGSGNRESGRTIRFAPEMPPP